MILFAAADMSNDSDSDGVALGGVCPSSLTVAQTEDLTRFGLCVSPSAKLPRPWRIFADGHPTLGPPASREELRKHPSGRYDRPWRAEEALDEVQAVMAVQQVVALETAAEEDEWLLSSSDDDSDGDDDVGDGGGNAAVIDLTEED
ncbi:hypothetical protein ZWY2020_047222 [Hordeum vulgare]|nr:hypothetical protein ZWY2020_047222 [Hordeum vulgare]